MDSEDHSVESSMMDTSVNRAGLIRIMKEDAASQTENDFHMIPQPPIRKLRDFDPRVKKLVSKLLWDLICQLQWVLLLSKQYVKRCMIIITTSVKKRLFKMTHLYLSIMNKNKSRTKTCLVPRRCASLISKINHHQARRITYHTRMSCLVQKY